MTESNLKVSYYPGCSSHGTGVELDQSTRELCNILGIEINELEDWNCCGASSAHAVSHELSVSLAARNLAKADAIGNDLITPCSACFGRLAAARKHILDHGAPNGVSEATGKAEVMNIFDLFSKDEILEKLEKIGGGALKGIKLVPYYGCLTSRPIESTGHKSPENPMEMEKIFEVLGAETIDWPYKTQCCGGGLTMPRADIVGKLSTSIHDMANRYGAEAIVTGCPMCFMNLERQWVENADSSTKLLPIFYFTELMLLALDPLKVRDCLKRHLSDPKPLLIERELV